MTREEYLRAKIYSRYRSINSFAQAVNLPYSTVASIIRNVGGGSLENLKKICAGLDITLDDLAMPEVSEHKNSYYLDKEASEYAEYARTNPDIRIMFSAAKGMSKEQMAKTVEYINFLKALERKDDD